MDIDSLLDDIHKGILVSPHLKILAKALEAERDAHLSTKNVLKLTVISKKNDLPLGSLAFY